MSHCWLDDPGPAYLLLAALHRQCSSWPYLVSHDQHLWHNMRCLSFLVQPAASSWPLLSTPTAELKLISREATQNLRMAPETPSLPFLTFQQWSVARAEPSHLDLLAADFEGDRRYPVLLRFLPDSVLFTWLSATMPIITLFPPVASIKIFSS